MSYLDICAGQLPVDEGSKSHPYRDTVGILTIGVGRNLESVGLRQDEISLMLRNDSAAADKDAQALVPSFQALSDQRKAVLVNMCFNLGRSRLSAFVRFLGAVSDGRFNDAADEMLASMWAVQVGQRAQRLAKMMREG